MMTYSLLDLSEAHLLVRIERLVQRTQKGHVRPFAFRDELIELLYLFNYRYNPEYDYSCSVCIQLFISLKADIESCMGGDYSSLNAQDDVFIQSLMKQLQQDQGLLGQEEIRRQNNYHDNEKSLELYLNQLFTHYHKLLIVRVDLKYQQEFAHLINIARFATDMKQLLRFVGKRRRCFKDLKGYVWALEQGDQQGGYHCHLLLIYSASQHQVGWYYANQVKQVWKDITKQQGQAFNCHEGDYIQRYIDEGTYALDIVCRSDRDKQKRVQEMANYLVKNRQHLRVKLPGMKTYDHGQFAVKSRRRVENTLYELSKDLSSDIPDDLLVHEF